MFTHAIARFCIALCLLGSSQGELLAQISTDDATKASATQLIDWLNSDRFQTRNLAHRELFSRGFANLHPLVDASFSRFPEQRMRAERILYRLQSAEIDAALPHPKFRARLENPRFWGGSNQYLGGIQDYSLDSDIHLDFEAETVGKLLSPMRVSSAKTDSGEVLRIQVWQANWTDSKQLSLYLQQPERQFRTVAIDLRVLFLTRLDDEATVALSEGCHQIHKGRCWLEVRKVIDTKRKREVLKVTLIDYFGRLDNPANTLQWSNIEQDSPEEVTPSSNFRRSWHCIPLEKNLAELHLRIKSGDLVSHGSATVVCPHPGSDKN